MVYLLSLVAQRVTVSKAAELKIARSSVQLLINRSTKAKSSP